MAQTRDSIQDIWGERTPYAGNWPERVDQHTLAEPDAWVQSACVLCSNGCGMDIGVKDGKMVGVRGRPMDHTNRGRLGPKGLHGWMANHADDRLTHPLIRRHGKLEKATWDEAMELVVRKSQEARDNHTASSIGFYTTGQIFLEEYYTLGVVGKAGLGTPHMDGNTRLCTATAAASLMETFGSDGQPGCYQDIDTTACIFLVGHNVAATQTVFWTRMLDRRHGPNPPKLIVVDPRRSDTAREADVHLQLRSGTNVALLNGLLRLIIEAGHIDHQFIEKHTFNFEKLKETVSQYTPELVASITGVKAEKLLEAAEILGTTPSLVSTCLQGVYQSQQATAAACQVNNLNLIRGLIGKEGSGILQMNGQPTAQNNRESGCDGALPAFRNWDNMKQVEELARIWNVYPSVIPHWATPTHAMQIFRFAEQGSIRFLWIVATNPAVSLPELARIRKILDSSDVFVVVQDAFLTETAHRADVVLPAALWGEKMGTFTNTDRTVHLSYKAVEPPGEARPDLDIFLDYAQRMGFKDKDGQPLIKWKTAEEAFEAWKECSRGRPCDYSGLSYAKLTGGPGIQWPVNEQHPDGTERLYTDHVFPTDADYCETHGHDLATGAALTVGEYKAKALNGRAWLKEAQYKASDEPPDEKYPFLLTTGRVVYHFHTRTKTARVPALQKAAPDAFVEISVGDARRLGIAQDDWVELESRRGKAQARARIVDIAPLEVFMPFHYGYWDGEFRPRAANELTITEWDPVSKQPYFKHAAVSVRRIEADELAADPDKAETGAGSFTASMKGMADKIGKAMKE